MTQNVVTYTVVITTDNPDGRLLPYLTTNLRVDIDQRHGVLLVPNASLRWQPRREQVVPAARAAFDHGATERKRERGTMAWCGSWSSASSVRSPYRRG
jgi:HlyD family secretion protein